MYPNDSNPKNDLNDPIKPVEPITEPIEPVEPIIEPIEPVEPIIEPIEPTNEPVEPIIVEPLDSPQNTSTSTFFKESQSQFKSESKTKTFERVAKETKNEAKNGMEEVLFYIQNNKESLFTYLFLILGLIFLVLGDFFWGSLILGLTAGYHFSYEIVFYLRNLSHLFDGHEHLRFLVLTAVIIGLFISIPGMFMGAIAAAVFKYVIYDKKE